jgi:hypothetical protein
MHYFSYGSVIFSETHCLSENRFLSICNILFALASGKRIRLELWRA